MCGERRKRERTVDTGNLASVHRSNSMQDNCFVAEARRLYQVERGFTDRNRILRMSLKLRKTTNKRRNMEEKKNQPVHEIRLGSIRASIWGNCSKSGGTWFSVTTSRAYKDGVGAWNDSRSFRDYDLPTLGSVLEMAQAWIRTQPDSVIHEAVSIHAMDENGSARVQRKSKKRRSK
jgi:hypothetical protein